jgi:peptide/nickel transport system substrate-binding protein
MGSSEFTINVAPNALAGMNTILIQGTDGSIRHAISLILLVQNSTSVSASTSANNITSTTTPSTPKCLIATATYGSELSPEVQLLRNFRDNSLEKSKIGSSFLIVFNAWYYSFSPRVANFINDHLIAREVMKGILYPLIAFIFLSSRVYMKLSAFPEFAAVASGLLASALIGAFYIGLPLGLLNRRVRLLRSWSLKACGIAILIGVSAILFSEILDAQIALMISSSLTVLSAMFASAALTAVTMSRNPRSVRDDWSHDSI